MATKVATKAKTKKMKRWVWSGSKNSRHERLSGETVDLFKPFSNGLQYPGDHRGAEGEWANCQCHLEIIAVDVATGNEVPLETLRAGEAAEAPPLRPKLDYDTGIADKEFLSQGELTSAQKAKYKDAVGRYAGNENYNAIQNAVKGVKVDAATNKAAKDILQLLEEVPATTREIEGWRGLSLKEAPKVGDVLEGNGLTSLSVSPEVAEVAAERVAGERYLFRIKVPEGTKLINVESSFPELAQGEGVVFHEGELILKPNTQFKILGESGASEAGYPIYDVEIVGEAEAGVDIAALDAQYKEVFSDWSESLTKKERSALNSYQTTTHGEWNGYLRQGEFGGDAAANPYYASIEKQIKNLDSALEKTALTEDTVVFRGVTNKGLGVLEDQVGASSLEDLAGKRFTERGFMSTSVDEAVPTEFGEATIRIQVPAGERGAYMNARGAPNEFVEKQFEMLLPRDTTFEITGASDAGGEVVIDMRVVPEAAFPSVEESKLILDQLGKDWAKTLTQAEKATLQEYTGKTFGDIQQALRTGEGMTPELEKTIKELDDILAKPAATLDSNVTVYRGFSDYKANFEVDSLEDLVGKEWTEEAYSSTTTRLNTAQKFSSRTGNNITFEIKVPKGTPGARVSELGGKFGAAEEEFLLPRGTRFKITDVKTSQEMGGQGTTAFVEVVPEAEAGAETVVTSAADSFTPSFTSNAKKMTKVVDDATSAIDEVMTLPENFPKLEVRLGEKQGSGFVKEARVRGTGDGLVTETDQYIRLAPEAGPDELVHEIGHVLKDELQLVTNKELKPILQAVKDTDSYRAITDAYYRQETEIWARTYEQWVATRSGSTAMRAAQKKFAEEGFGYLTDTEFEKIAQMMDDLLADKVELKVGEVSAEAVIPRAQVPIGEAATKEEYEQLKEWYRDPITPIDYVEQVQLDYLERMLRFAEKNPSLKQKEVEFREFLQSVYDARVAGVERTTLTTFEEAAAKIRAPKPLEIRQGETFGTDFTSNTRGDFVVNNPKAQKWAEDNFGDWGKTITKEEADAINAYSGGGEFLDMNGALRQGKKLTKIDPAVKTEIDNLEAALKRSVLKEDITTYRLGRFPKGLQPGDVFVDDGFVSTTLDGQLVAEGGDFAGAALDGKPMRILVPEGTEGGMVDVTGISGEGFFADEAEIVLQRGTQFEYVGEVDGMQTFRVLPRAEEVASAEEGVTVETFGVDFTSETGKLAYKEEATQKWAKDEFSEWGKGLSKEQRKALNTFGQKGGSADFNSVLRAGKKKGVDPKLLDKITDMSSSIEKSALREDVTSYRLAELPKGLKPGQRFVDKGFTTSSLDGNVVENFAKTAREGQSKIKILAPQDTRATLLDAAKADADGAFTLQKDAQLVFQKNTQFEYLGTDADGYEVLRVVPREPLQAKKWNELVPGDTAITPEGKRVKLYEFSKDGKQVRTTANWTGKNVKWVDRESLVGEAPSAVLEEGEIFKFNGSGAAKKVVGVTDNEYVVENLSQVYYGPQRKLIPKNSSTITKLTEQEQKVEQKYLEEEIAEAKQTTDITQSLNFKYGQSFESVEGPQLDAWANKNWKPWQKSLTEEEKTALNGYQSIDYESINNTLRGITKKDQFAVVPKEQIQKEIDTLKAAVDRAVVPEDVTAYRTGVIDVPDLKPGDIFTDDGFTSTTVNPNRSEFFEIVEKKTDVVRIQVPKGSKGVPINMGTDSGMGLEAELTLQAGTEFQYLGIDADGLQVIKVINKESDLVKFEQREFKPGKVLSDDEIADLDLQTPLQPTEIDFSQGEFMGAQDSPVNQYLNRRFPKDIDPEKANLIDEYIGAQREQRGVGNIQRRIADDIRRGTALSEEDLITQIRWDQMVAESPPLGRNMTVYRGVGDFTQISEGISPSGTLEVGDVFVDEALSSTTANREFADYFARVRNAGEVDNTAIFEIRLTAEQRGLWTQRYYETPIQEALNAQEFVLPRGTQFRIEGIATDARGQKVVTLSVDPVAAAPKDYMDLWQRPPKIVADSSGEPWVIDDIVETPNQGRGRIVARQDASGPIKNFAGSTGSPANVTVKLDSGEYAWFSDNFGELKRVNIERTAARQAEADALRVRYEKILKKEANKLKTVQADFERKFGDVLSGKAPTDKLVKETGITDVKPPKSTSTTEASLEKETQEIATSPNKLKVEQPVKDVKVGDQVRWKQEDWEVTGETSDGRLTIKNVKTKEVKNNVPTHKVSVAEDVGTHDAKVLGGTSDPTVTKVQLDQGLQYLSENAEQLTAKLESGEPLVGEELNTIRNIDNSFSALEEPREVYMSVDDKMVNELLDNIDTTFQQGNYLVTTGSRTSAEALAGEEGTIVRFELPKDYPILETEGSPTLLPREMKWQIQKAERAEGRLEFVAKPVDAGQRISMDLRSVAHKDFRFAENYVAPKNMEAVVQRSLSSTSRVIKLPEELKVDVSSGGLKAEKLAKGVRGEFFEDGRVVLDTTQPLDTQVTAFTHETGHALDYYLGGGNSSWFEYSDEAKALREAITKSDAFQALVKQRNLLVKQAEAIDVNLPGGAVKYLDIQKQADYLEYLTRSDEAFARAFAQYVGETTGDIRILSTLENEKLIQASQWESADFQAIKKEMDEVLKGKELKVEEKLSRIKQSGKPIHEDLDLNLTEVDVGAEVQFEGELWTIRALDSGQAKLLNLTSGEVVEVEENLLKEKIKEHVEERIQERAKELALQQQEQAEKPEVLVQGTYPESLEELMLSEGLLYSIDVAGLVGGLSDEIRLELDKRYEEFLKEAQPTRQDLKDYKEALAELLNPYGVEQVKKALQGQKVPEKYEDAAFELADLFEHVNGLSHNWILYMGLSQQRVLPGTSFTFSSLASASADINVAGYYAYNYANPKPGSIIRMLARAGSKVVGLEGTVPIPPRKTNQAEILVPPGTVVRVSGPSGEYKGIPVHDANLEIP